MHETFLLVCHVAISGMSILKNLVESFNLLKEKVSRRDIDKFEEYILGESLKMKKAMSREHMLSEGVSEAHVDCVIEEVRIFIPRVKITDEIRSQCGYENMALADLLWCEYCRINDKNKFAEYENDLKKGLFVVAKAWNEPSEESIKSCIEFLQRIDSKSSSILLNVKEVKNDTEDINRTVKSTEKKVEEQNNVIEKMSCTTENTNDMVWEIHQLFLGKSGEKQIAGGQEGYNPERMEDAPEDATTPDGLRQEAADTEESLPDEITICLAAVLDEFQEDIDSLQEFIEEQNRSQNNVRLKLQCCDGKIPQDIVKSKYCYILVGNVMEQWMQETYELAYRLYSEAASDTECVQLHMCFRTTFAGEALQTDESDIEEWKNRYWKDFHRIPLAFQDMNRIKLDMLLNLRTKAPDVVFSTKSIIQFRNHPELEKAYKERDELQRQYEKNYDTDYQGAEEKDKIEKQEKELRDKNDRIEETEKDIWNHLELLTEKVQDKSTMDVREAEAIEDVIEYGDYRKAEETLRSREWAEEIAAVEQSMREKKEVLKKFISSQRTLISNLKTKGTGDEIIAQIVEIYERITELSKEWHIEYIAVYEFAEFCLNCRKFKEGIRVAEELKCLYEQSDCTSAEEQVRMLKLLGDLYYNDTGYEKGKKYYKEAFDLLRQGNSDNFELRAMIYNDLSQLFWKTKEYEQAEKGLDINIASLSRVVESNPEVYEPILATAYNYRALVANRRNQLDKAIECHKEVLKIRKRLAGKSSSYNYRPLMNLTNTYNNIGVVYKKKEDYQEAEKYYTEAIKLRYKYAERNPSVFLRSLALVYNNYATMLNVRGDNEKAQEICKEAYRIRRELADKDESYKVMLASTSHEYGIILTDAGEDMYPQALNYFEEAVKIRESLAKEDKQTYGLDLAETNSRYGKLLAQMGDFPFDEEYYRRAEENMQAACDFCDKYSKQNRDFDTDKTTEIYHSFALLLDKRLKKYSDAEIYYKKALEGYRYLTEQCREVFEPKLKKAEAELAELQERI